MKSFNRNLIPLTFLIGTAALFFMTLSRSGPKLPSESGKGKRYLELQKTKSEAIRRVELNYRQADLHSQVAPNVERARPSDSTQPLDLEPERNIGAQDASDDSLKQSQTLDQKMDGFLAHRQHFEAMENIQKVEYVKEFIKEARAMGYDVTINDKLEIVKVRKISPK